MLALAEHEATVHEPCGQPAARAFSADMDGEYEVDAGNVCQACAAIDRYRGDHPELEPGTVLRVVDIATREPRPWAPGPYVPADQRPPED